mgnify:FL=1|tara:strand:+ start:674 stop:1048 length:375 start_codon:yes stop_codon:yes gene_type:complete
MNFTINKNSTLPVLNMELIKDGRYTYREFKDKIQNCNFYFTMADLNTGVKVIGRKAATLTLKSQYNGCEDEEYYLTYQFTEKQTSKPGTYIGSFTIEFLDGSGTLIVPIQEELIINILDGSIRR